MSDGRKLPPRKHRTLGAADRTVRMARRLRKEMSLPEVLLWRELKLHPGGYLFRKQHPLGTYSLDFACIRARLAIEVDGEAHERGDRPEREEARDAFVLDAGFATMRIATRDVLKNMEGVVIGIVEACRTRIPPRNGEVAGAARRRGRSGRDSSVDGFILPQPTPPPPLRDGPPPRSGEDLL